MCTLFTTFVLLKVLAVNAISSPLVLIRLIDFNLLGFKNRIVYVG